MLDERDTLWSVQKWMVPVHGASGSLLPKPWMRKAVSCAYQRGATPEVNLSASVSSLGYAQPREVRLVGYITSDAALLSFTTFQLL